MHPLLVKAGIGAAALAAGTGLMLGSASSAVADDAPVSMSIQSPATLIAHGAAINVPVLVTCPAGTNAFMRLSVTQAVGKRTASAQQDTDVACTGAPQTVTVTLTTDGVPFSKGGNAYAQGYLSACVPSADGCDFVSVPDDAVININ